jgi:glycosyltransferase involved in cell wall biosynthesis
MNHGVWVHDAFFSLDDGGNPVAGGLPATLWERYLRAFDTLTVVGRSGPNQGGAASEAREEPRVRYVPVPSIHSARLLLVNRRAAARAIYEAVAKGDAVIARLPSLNGELAVQAAMKLGRPYAVEVVGCGWDAFWNYGTIQGRLMAPRTYWTMRRLTLKAPYVIYVTQAFLQRRYPTRGVQAGISDVDLVGWDEGLVASRADGPEHPSPFVLGTIGYLGNEYKGLRVLLEALAEARRQRPDLVLRVLGSGDTARWQALAAALGVGDHVHFDGTLPPGAPVNAWLDDLDLYVHPSLVEGLPRAVIEAMARACPALGSTAGGIPELLDPSALHPPGDRARLASDLLRATEDAGWRRAQSAANFERAGGYRREVLVERRSQFWADFAAYARGAASLVPIEAV